MQSFEAFYLHVVRTQFYILSDPPPLFIFACIGGLTLPPPPLPLGAYVLNVGPVCLSKPFYGRIEPDNYKQ